MSSYSVPSNNFLKISELKDRHTLPNASASKDGFKCAKFMTVVAAHVTSSNSMPTNHFQQKQEMKIGTHFRMPDALNEVLFLLK